MKQCKPWSLNQNSIRRLRSSTLPAFLLTLLMVLAACTSPEPTATLPPTPTATATPLPPTPTLTPEAVAPKAADISFSQFNLEAYWYSRYVLSRAHARSGFGAHMLQGPLFQGDLDKLKTTVGQFSELTGHPIPTSPWRREGVDGVETPSGWLCLAGAKELPKTSPRGLPTLVEGLHGTLALPSTANVALQSFFLPPARHFLVSRW